VTPTDGMSSLQTINQVVKRGDLWMGYHVWKEEFKDTKAVIRIHRSKKDRQNNDKKKDKKTNNDLQNIHIKVKIG